jgi:hypothetical protein
MFLHVRQNSLNLNARTIFTHRETTAVDILLLLSSRVTKPIRVTRSLVDGVLSRSLPRVILLL